jgi:hypothetical protein
MRLMRRHDPQTQEDGFHTLLPLASEHVADLLTEFDNEHNDHGLRCWLLELIGHARSERALPVLAEQLRSPDEALSQRAVRGLQLLDTKEARRLLWQRNQNSRPSGSEHSQSQTFVDDEQIE